MIREEPTCINARITLAKVLANRGNYPEAITLASIALKHAEEKKRHDFIPEARATLIELRSKYYVSR